MKTLRRLTVVAGLLVAAACVPQSEQPTLGTPPANGPQGQQKTNATPQNPGNQGEQSADSTPTGTTPPNTSMPVIPDGVVLPPEQTVQERYPNWVDPSQAELDNPKRAKIYNYTNDGIKIVNGQTLPQVVPPGKVALVAKRSTDINNSTGGYRVSVTTDTGKTGSAEFDPDNVNMANWRASVTDDGSTLQIQENAGGGGDGSGGGEDNFEF